MQPDKTTPVANPTWYADIRYLFTATDITHMKSHGIDLSLYDVVKTRAPDIYSQVAAGLMPKAPPGTSPPNPNAWPTAWVTTFLNWITNGYPKGLPQTALITQKAGAISKATRIRKNITIVATDKTELETLKKAFTGIMAKINTDPNSYFAQAGVHGLPNAFCQHHVPAYNPWHRAYLVSFENALRSVPGCENVTIPYWDITTPFPDVLKNPPFNQYIIPLDLDPTHPKGPTTRNPYPQFKRIY